MDSKPSAHNVDFDPSEVTWVEILRCESESELSFATMVLESEEIPHVIDNKHGNVYPSRAAILAPRVRVPAEWAEYAQCHLAQVLGDRWNTQKKIKMPLIMKVVFTVMIVYGLWTIVSTAYGF